MFAEMKNMVSCFFFSSFKWSPDASVPAKEELLKTKLLLVSSAQDRLPVETDLMF